MNTIKSTLEKNMKTLMSIFLFIVLTQSSAHASWKSKVKTFAKETAKTVVVAGSATIACATVIIATGPVGCATAGAYTVLRVNDELNKN